MQSVDLLEGTFNVQYDDGEIEVALTLSLTLTLILTLTLTPTLTNPE